MTTRLYDQDAYLRTFTATVVERLLIDNRIAVVLDRTAFYPTGGGQPFDRGKLNQSTVVDVVERPEDGALIHFLAEEVWEDEVRGEIDWPRRFDHMQQHTGQHVLSQAFVHAAGAQTVAFHLGQDAVTIDLNKPDLAPALIERAETLANEVVWRNLAVRTALVDAAQLQALGARVPPDARLPLRLIEIEGFDRQACSGTHVLRTGEIGLIKLVRIDRRGAELRVEFLCGARALSDYRRKNQVVLRAAAGLSVAPAELEAALARQQTDLKTLRAQVRHLIERQIDLEAIALWAEGEREGALRVVRRVFTDRTPTETAQLARRIVQRGGTAVLFGIAGDKSHLVFARSSDVERDMVMLVRAAATVMGGEGGGQADFAQAGGPAANEARVDAAVNRAYRLLLAQR
jgi:alanyl-tRNA synthetase